MFLDQLNKEQQQAVTSDAQHTLVLAGAGSGKTRVLIHRIAWLLQQQHCQPHNILAVTFTNKAAAEMRGRIESLLNMNPRAMWVGTFHSLAHRLLRLHWKEAKLIQTFQVLDSQDQLRMIKRLMKAHNVDDTRYPARQVQGFINGRKDEGQRVRHLGTPRDPYQKQMTFLYQEYEAACERGGLVDFAELLLRSHELWLNNPALLEHYQNRFQVMLVDEFQDTNTLQYAWLCMIAGQRNNLFAVGDDDQSIYGWRGAKVENIQRFSKDFSDSQLFRLEQNYRSTSTILDAANALIENNTARLGKKLWTDGQAGQPIKIYKAFNDLDEAEYIASTVKDHHSKGQKFKDIALLYRSNAQSRVLEEALLRAQIPYRIYGGLRFYERAEIKDAIAYCRLMAHPNDDSAFERAVNMPPRGIGERTLAQIRETAMENDISLWKSAQVTAQTQLKARARTAVLAFLELIQSMQQATQTLSLEETVTLLNQRSGLLDHYKNEKGEQARTRVENLEELVTAAQEFDTGDNTEETIEEEMTPMMAFLGHAALETGDQQADIWEDSVQMMTLHSAKGLEFPVVFLGGMEDGLFPHQRCIDDPKQLQEERRLCYVGITRAKQQLYMTLAEKRRLYQRDTFSPPSRFLAEIPEELCEEIRKPSKFNFTPRPKAAGSSLPEVKRGVKFNDTTGDGKTWQIGQRVQHKKFGLGVILGYEGQGSHTRVQVNFENAGSKWLVLSYAKLQTV